MAHEQHSCTLNPPAWELSHPTEGSSDQEAPKPAFGVLVEVGEEGRRKCLSFCVYRGEGRRLHITITSSWCDSQPSSHLTRTLSSLTVATAAPHLPNLPHTGADGVWSWEQPGMQN